MIGKIWEALAPIRSHIIVALVSIFLTGTFAYMTWKKSSDKFHEDYKEAFALLKAQVAKTDSVTAYVLTLRDSIDVLTKENEQRAIANEQAKRNAALVRQNNNRLVADIVERLDSAGRAAVLTVDSLRSIEINQLKDIIKTDSISIATHMKIQAAQRHAIDTLTATIRQLNIQISGLPPPKKEPKYFGITIGKKEVAIATFIGGVVSALVIESKINHKGQ